MPREHPPAHEATAHLAELAQEPWIAGCPRCRGHLVQLADAAGFRPDVAYETEDYVAVMGLVAEGLGVALIPDLILRTVHPDQVVALPMEPASRRPITALTTPDLGRVPAVRATLEALIESAGSQSTAPTVRQPEPTFSI